MGGPDPGLTRPRWSTVSREILRIVEPIRAPFVLASQPRAVKTQIRGSGSHELRRRYLLRGEDPTIRLLWTLEQCSDSFANHRQTRNRADRLQRSWFTDSRSAISTVASMDLSLIHIS